MTAAEESGWRRLSQRMLLIHPIQELPRAFPALIGVVAAGSGSGGHAALWGIIGVVIPVGLGITRWFTTSFRVTHDRVEVRRAPPRCTSTAGRWSCSPSCTRPARTPAR